MLKITHVFDTRTLVAMKWHTSFSISSKRYEHIGLCYLVTFSFDDELIGLISALSSWLIAHSHICAELVSTRVYKAVL
jgi:hypothetical protein